jgi:hypothetical protein
MLTEIGFPTSKANVPIKARRKLGRRGLRQREAKSLYYIEQANQGTGSVHNSQCQRGGLGRSASIVTNAGNKGKPFSAYGDFISQWPWDHYGTFTFGRQLSQSRCLQHWDEFIDSLGRNTRGRVGWVRADEQRWSGYGSPEIPLHYHVLLKYENVPAPEGVAALWKSKAGNAKVEIYECARGAA